MKNLAICLFFVPVVILAVCAIILFVGCTYNISMAHTEGVATDTIDDTQSNTPNVSPTITAIPGMPI